MAELLLPPTEPGFLSFIDRMLRLLPRKIHSLLVVPVQDVESNSFHEDAYLTKRIASSFILHGESDLFDTGWLYFEGILKRYSLNRVKLYIDNGCGYTESNAITIPVTLRGYIRELVYLPEGVVGLRWVPIDSDGFIVQQSLQITRIGRFEATLRASGRVLFDLRRFLSAKNRRKSAIKKLLNPLLRMRLWEAYHHTVSFRIFDGTAQVNAELWETYTETIQRHLPAIDQQYKRLHHYPLVTVVMHLVNITNTSLKLTLQSLRQQCYQNWELIVSGDLSLTELCPDERIFMVNKEIERPIGQYVVYMDCNLKLEQHVLFRFVQAFQQNNADLVYSDGVQLADDGDDVVDFICRPTFSPELLRAYQYIDHLVGFDQLFLDSLGVTGKNLFDFLPYDLLLRVAEKAKRVVHIPEFLYHISEKEPFRENVAVIQRHLERIGCAGKVEPHTHHGMHRISYSLNSGLRVAIIIPTKNAGELLCQCLDSLLRTISDIPYDIIIIDHDSDEPKSLSCLEALSRYHTVLRYSGSFNFSRINNWAVKQISGQYSHYLFCNNDIEAIHEGWLENMIGFAQFPDIGVVGVQLLYPDQQHIQHAGVGAGLHGVAEHYGKFLPVTLDTHKTLNAGARLSLSCTHEVSAVTGACMVVRRDAFDNIGGFDEHLAVGFGDVDLCLRIVNAGYRCIYAPDSTLIHHESFTRGKNVSDPHPADTAFFRKRWKTLLEKGDPYYNPAYSINSFSWEYSVPLSWRLQPEYRVWVRPSGLVIE